MTQHWMIVGAAPECDVVIDSPSVSGRHAQVRLDASGFIELRDLGSRNGIYVDGRPVESARVTRSQAVILGTQPVDLFSLLDGAATSTRPVAETVQNVADRASEPELITVGQGFYVLGREAGCDRIIADPAVSAHHARVFESGGRVIIEDLGSRNGTFVRSVDGSSEEMVRSRVVGPRDIVRIGSEAFRFQSPQRSTEGARLDVRRVSYEVKSRDTGKPLKLVNDISFTAKAGEVVGILGPSGSGKTTLLDVVAGFLAPSEGQVLIQNGDLHREDGVMRMVGHAPQFDVVHGSLTVAEAVRYSALLRGPKSWSRSEVERRVDEAIAAVGLSEKRDVPIGSAVRKTLSGGQKKRVNIAMELVLDPKVLLLDEPSSGLSAHDTVELMRLLRQMAAQGKTILLTIHQPSYACFVMMDHIILLEEGGHLAYFGPAALDSFDYFDIADREPGALLEGIPKKSKENYPRPGPVATRYLKHPLRDLMVLRRAADLDAAPPPPPQAPPIRGVLGHTLQHLVRGLQLKLRDPFFLLLTLFAPALVSLMFVGVLGAGLGEDPTDLELSAVNHKYFLVLTVMTCLFGALSAALEVVSELPIIRRERRGEVGVAAYLAGKSLLYLIPAALFPAVALGVCHLLANGFSGDPIQQWVVLGATFFAAACAGLLLSATTESPQTVIVLAVFYAIIQVVFAVFAPLEVTYEDPPRAQWLQAVSAPITARWTLSGLVSTRDLCEDVKGANLESEPKNPRFMAGYQCSLNYYRHHGVAEPFSTEARTDFLQRRNSLLANGLLSIVALLLCGVYLSRKSRVAR